MLPSKRESGYETRIFCSKFVAKVWESFVPCPKVESIPLLVSLLVLTGMHGQLASKQQCVLWGRFPSPKTPNKTEQLKRAALSSMCETVITCALTHPSPSPGYLGTQDRTAPFSSGLRARPRLKMLKFYYPWESPRERELGHLGTTADAAGVCADVCDLTEFLFVWGLDHSSTSQFDWFMLRFRWNTQPDADLIPPPILLDTLSRLCCVFILLQRWPIQELYEAVVFKLECSFIARLPWLLNRSEISTNPRIHVAKLHPRFDDFWWGEKKLQCFTPLIQGTPLSSSLSPFVSFGSPWLRIRPFYKLHFNISASIHLW